MEGKAFEFGASRRLGGSRSGVGQADGRLSDSSAVAVDAADDIHGTETRNILGLSVCVTRAPHAIRQIDDAVRTRTPLRIAFANSNLANIAKRQPEVATVLDDFLLLNDGAGLDLASVALYGKPFPENLNGTDFTPRYLSSSERSLKVFLLGSTDRVVSEVAALFAQRWPQHQVVGFHHGFFDQAEEEGLAHTIRASKPDLVLVAMGNPLQEAWLRRYVPEVCPVGIGVGALFDFLSDKAVRAPSLVRRYRLEWFYRLVREPRRLWRRYILGNPVFIARVCAQYLRGERA